MIQTSDRDRPEDAVIKDDRFICIADGEEFEMSVDYSEDPVIAYLEDATIDSSASVTLVRFPGEKLEPYFVFKNISYNSLIAEGSEESVTYNEESEESSESQGESESTGNTETNETNTNGDKNETTS